MKKILMLLLLSMLSLINYAQESTAILQIGNETITKDKIELSQEQMIKMFQQQYKKKYTEDDAEMMIQFKKAIQTQILSSAVQKIITKHAEENIFNEVVSEEDMRMYIEKNKNKFSFDITLANAYLAAIEFLKYAKEPNKYEVAYEKYMKYKENLHYCSLSFFKNNIHNPAFEVFLKNKLKNGLAGELSLKEKQAMFNENLPSYIMKQAAKQDESVAAHLKLSEKNPCNFRDFLISQWFVSQGNALGVKMYDNQYGSSIKQIIENGMKSQMQFQFQ